MRSSDFDYELPDSAVAQTPSRRRDACRLAVVERLSGRVTHVRFRDLGSFLDAGDLLVLNDSKVLPARVPCRRLSGGAVELFLLEPLVDGLLPAFVRPAGRVKFGEALRPEREPGAGAFVLESRREDGVFFFRWDSGRRWSGRLLQGLGLPPLPPYIQRDRIPCADAVAGDRRRYQTVYAREAGSVAAPTAGLHFTRGLLARLKERGIGAAHVTLHVGPGTFQPVKTDALEDHPMHSEWCRVPPEAAGELGACRSRKGRVVAVGTTTVRTLESCALDGGAYRAGPVETRLFIVPGYRFKSVDALLTNFHQPRSTLLPLVAAFWDRRKLLDLYRDCLGRGYRFLSYGDACLFL